MTTNENINGNNENAGSKCGLRVKAMSVTDDGIWCEICGLCFRCRCQEHIFRAVNQFRAELHWFCRGCQAGAEKLLEVMSTMQFKIDRLEDELNRLRIPNTLRLLKELG